MNFSDMNFAGPIADALAAEGYTTPTPIQVQAIPIVLQGRDLLGIAQTGTGKTAAFAVPTLDHLSRNARPLTKRSARVLVLAPTRELASQIAESFRIYGQNLRLSVQTVFGGVPIRRQMTQVANGVDVLVATPGRLIDLIEQRALILSGVEVLILDEADQMLDLGFIHALRKIVALVPKKRQTLFFSATMPKSIEELAGKYLTDPAHVAVAPVATTAEKVDQRVVYVQQRLKPSLLTRTLTTVSHDRVLVFTRTKHGADRVVRQLARDGITAAAIHGNKSQPQREKALAAFREGTCRVLIATDIAARGIDVDGISLVVNFDLPNVPEQYVHRIGRTARAGASGLAVSFCADDEKPYLKSIEKLTRQRLFAENAPTDLAPPVETQQDRDRDREHSDQSRQRRPQGGQRSGGGSGQGNKPKSASQGNRQSAFAGGGQSGGQGGGQGGGQRRRRKPSPANA